MRWRFPALPSGDCGCGCNGSGKCGNAGMGDLVDDINRLSSSIGGFSLPWWAWTGIGVGVLWLLVHPKHRRMAKGAELASARASYLRRRARIQGDYSVRAGVGRAIGRKKRLSQSRDLVLA